MPEKLIIAEEHHHNLGYHSVHAEYALLANLSERPLEMHEMYDADNGDIPPELLERRDLYEEQVYLSMDEVLTGREIFKALTYAISA